MNKTVNINLGGTFFHIDEDAYGKLTHYLDAIKRSFKDPQGQEEIIRDIEARIAELFSERIDHKRQVISTKEVDEVIAIMGQPEDYAVDEEIFDDAPHQQGEKTKTYKKLYRDMDNKYLGGVSSGLGHYIGIDAIWIRLLWILLTIFSSGTFILIYVLFWVLVPEAKTVAEKLTMRGEPVNISNIEKKFKENYDSVADKIKNANYDEYGQRIKSGSEAFFDALGKVLLAILTVFVKFIGVLLVLIGAFTIIGLFIGLIFASFTGIHTTWYNEMFTVISSSFMPLWLFLLLVFFAIAIPFFYLLLLGLKILINNLKSIGKITKLSLLAIWILAIIGLFAFGTFQAAEQANEGSAVNTERLLLQEKDTLYLKMQSNDQYAHKVSRSGGMEIKLDENDREVLYSNNIRLIVKSTNDSLAAIAVDKKAKGRDYRSAKKRAEEIDYNFSLEDKTLLLDGYFTTDKENNFRSQEIEITLYLPVGMVLHADNNTYSFHRNTSNYGDILNNGDEGHYLEILDGKTLCLDCPAEKRRIIRADFQDIDWDSLDWNDDMKELNEIILNKEGIDININNLKDSIRMRMNKEGFHLKTN